MLPTQVRNWLLQEAREVLPRAYAPYSRLRVGAALLTEQGNFFSGANVENASYGLTMCAERTAIGAGVSREGGGMRIRALAVVCEGERPCAPCGACRQVIQEFGPEAVVIFMGAAGVMEMRANELLPEGFAWTGG